MCLMLFILYYVILCQNPCFRWTGFTAVLEDDKCSEKQNQNSTNPIYLSFNLFQVHFGKKHLCSKYRE